MHLTCHNARVLHPRAIIFDMDGLMVDSEPLWWRVERQLAEAHGHTWTDAMAMTCVGKGLPNVIVTMRRELGVDVAVPDGVSWLVDTFIARIEELTLKRGFHELSDAARAAAVPMAVASSSTARLIDAVLRRFGLTETFVATVSGDAVEHAKPAPDIFIAAAAILGIAPADCVVLEDSIAGVRAAVAAGAPVIAVPEHEPERFSSLTPHVVNDLLEARALIELG